MPVGAEQRGVADAHVRADAFDLLGIPDRECVVVAVGNQDALLPYRIEVVLGHLDGGVAVAPVVVVPVFFGHEGRHSEAEDGEGNRNGILGLVAHALAAPGGLHGSVCGGLPCGLAAPCCRLGSGLPALHGVSYPCVEGQRGEAHPDREGIERTGVGVVPLAHLIRRLVEVDHDGDAGHEEHQECHPCAPLVPCELEEEAEDAQKKRQHEVVVLALVLGQIGRSVALVAEPPLVEEADAALPVAGEHFSRCRAVDVVLPAGEVPHEIPPVHPVELVVEEERQVGPECRFLVLLARDDLALAVHVGLVEFLVFAVAAGGPHAREEHLALWGIFRRKLAVGPDVFVPHRSPVFRHFDVARGIEVLAVDQRVAAVLLAAEVADEGEWVIGLVLVGRSLDRRADDDYREYREADDYRSETEQDSVCDHLLFLHRPEEAPEAQDEEDDHEEGRAAVERQTENVDEEQVGPCADFREIRYYYKENYG